MIEIRVRAKGFKRMIEWLLKDFERATYDGKVAFLKVYTWEAYLESINYDPDKPWLEETDEIDFLNVGGIICHDDPFSWSKWVVITPEVAGEIAKKISKVDDSDIIRLVFSKFHKHFYIMVDKLPIMKLETI
jgi:hypothetical protein